MQKAQLSLFWEPTLASRLNTLPQNKSSNWLLRYWALHGGRKNLVYPLYLITLADHQQHWWWSTRSTLNEQSGKPTLKGIAKTVFTIPNIVQFLRSQAATLHPGSSGFIMRRTHMELFLGQRSTANQGRGQMYFVGDRVTWVHLREYNRFPFIYQYIVKWESY